MERTQNTTVTQPEPTQEIPTTTTTTELTQEIPTTTEPTNQFVTSLQLNWIFYVVMLCCLYAISYYGKTNFIMAIITFILMSFCGYLTHVGSHIIDFEHSFHLFDNKINNGITTNSWLNPIAQFIVYVLGFHNKIHHDLEKSKQIPNRIQEFVCNWVTQAGGLLFLKYLLSNLNSSVIFMWGFQYATVHMINYDLLQEKIHMKHHIDANTNLGMDIWDILFHTKYNNNNYEIEQHNHYSINTIILTGIMCYWLYQSNLESTTTKK